MKAFRISDSFHFDTVISVAAQLQSAPVEVRAFDLAAAIATVKGSGEPARQSLLYSKAATLVMDWVVAQDGYSDAYNEAFHAAERSVMAAIRSQAQAFSQGTFLRHEQINSFLEHPDSDEIEMCDGLVQIEHANQIVRCGTVAELVACAIPRAQVIANYVGHQVTKMARPSRWSGRSDQKC